MHLSVDLLSQNVALKGLRTSLALARLTSLLSGYSPSPLLSVLQPHAFFQFPKSGTLLTWKKAFILPGPFALVGMTFA